MFCSDPDPAIIMSAGSERGGKGVWQGLMRGAWGVVFKAGPKRLGGRGNAPGQAFVEGVGGIAFYQLGF